MDVVTEDLKHIWHPCAQMKDYQTFKPIELISARGSYLKTKSGKTLIDATASWWCKSLGHAHPKLQAALLRQMQAFEHVMFAHTTNETIVLLAKSLSTLTTSLNKMMFASEGSSVVEMAMKLSLHARKREGNNKRTQFAALQGAYHGETTGALSISDLSLYRAPYQEILFPCHFISSLPFVSGKEEACWNDCSSHWELTLKQLEPIADTLTAIFVEPIVQGAAGMRIYAKDFLTRLRAWTKEHGIHLIADEIMTGMGRTGKMLACEHANIEPDMLCLSKGLTSGFLPFSVMLTTSDLYELFYADFSPTNSFLHSHTHAGNALAASVALEVLKVMREENICEKAIQLGQSMLKHWYEIADETNKLSNIRSIGAIVAADLSFANNTRRIGFDIYQQAAERGALLRPIGNTIYWSPPLNMEEETLIKLKDITKKVLLAVD